MESGKTQQQHFILVHGLCHGAWCWYKVATMLRSAGHRVTALDLAACGASPVRADEVRSLAEYSQPLIDAVAAVPQGEKAVVVGHSFGRHSLALAMEAHPQKFAAAVFVSTAMPIAGRPMSIVFEQLKQMGPNYYMDSVVTISKNPENPVETFLLGPKYMAERLYQLSAPEDLTLATMLVRPSQRFLDDAMMKDTILTADKYGAVRRVYVVGENDNSWSTKFQQRMASSSSAIEVRTIEGADHMPMFSKPRELSELLMEIANKYN